MKTSSDEPPPCNGFRPEWADGDFCSCSLLKRDVLVGASGAEPPEDAEEKIAAFFYFVPAGDGGMDLGVRFVCSWLTLYVVLNGVPTTTFAQVKQVSLPICDTFDTASSGEGGSVLWSDMILQRVLRYDRMMPNGGDEHLLRYARYVSYLATPSFAGLSVTEVVGDEVDEVSRKGAKARRGKIVGGGEREKAKGGRWAAGEVEIAGDYKVIRIGKRKIDLSKKYKARAFLRFLCESLKAGNGQFYVESMRDDFNGRFDKAHEGKKWKSDRFREDLFKGVKSADFDLVFETLDQASGMMRLKI